MIIRDTRSLDTIRSRSLVELECERCRKSFWKPKNQVQAAKKGNSKNTFRFCSLECSRSAISNGKTYDCAQCSKEVYRSPSEMRKSRSGLAFCSQSCSAIYSNTHSAPDRKRGPTPAKRICKRCPNEVAKGTIVCNDCKRLTAEARDKRISSKATSCIVCKAVIYGRRTLCNAHQPKFDDNATLKNAEYTSGEMSNKYAKLRDHARKVARAAGILDKCELCGYDKCVAACHVKSISAFSKDALVKEVNAICNMIGLCPNHHWEFDHKLLSDEDNAKVRLILDTRILKP
jgi:hypothetical protein